MRKIAMVAIVGAAFLTSACSPVVSGHDWMADGCPDNSYGKCVSIKEAYREEMAKTGLPVWVANYMETTDMKPSGITRYVMDGKDFYLFDPPDGTADFPAQLYDDNGTYVCAPMGGFTGQGDGKCPIRSRESFGL